MKGRSQGVLLWGPRGQGTRLAVLILQPRFLQMDDHFGVSDVSFLIQQGKHPKSPAM